MPKRLISIAIVTVMLLCIPIYKPIAAEDDTARAHAHYKRIIRRENGTAADNIAILDAKDHTIQSLRALYLENRDKEVLIEGEYVVVHFPYQVWSSYLSNLPKLIETYDAIYKAQLDLTGGNAKVYEYKLLFLTNYAPDTPWMYMADDHCGTSVEAAVHNARSPYTVSELWGIGHEIGHAMVIKGMGNLFISHDSESWNNVLNVYALTQLGLGEQARSWVSQYSSEYYGENYRYGSFQDRDFDTLSDSERRTEILASNHWILVKLPMLLTDNYGWEGMQAFFTGVTEDYINGMRESRRIQNRIDYMVVNLSLAYGMDLSMLFDYWKVPPSESAKREIENLPYERIIAASYSLEPESRPSDPVASDEPENNTNDFDDTLADTEEEPPEQLPAPEAEIESTTQLPQIPTISLIPEPETTDAPSSPANQSLTKTESESTSAVVSWRWIASVALALAIIAVILILKRSKPQEQDFTPLR